MTQRYHFGQPLHHPNDETLVALPVRKSMSAFLAWARQKENKPYSRAWCDLENNWLKQMNMNTQLKSDGAPW
jgi:hypothetical protein